MKVDVRRFTVAAALAASVAVSPALAGAQTNAPTFPKAKFAKQPVEVERLTAGIHMTREDLAPTRGYTGPTSMAPKPGSPRVLVAATADLRNRTCHLLVSTNAGATWRFSEEPPAPPGYPYCTNLTAGVPEASVAWGRDGTLYYAMQAYGEGEGNQEGVTSIALARTKDLGKTWQTTIVTNARTEADPKPENVGVSGLAVDTSGPQDAIYVGFSRSWRRSTQTGHPLNLKRDVLVAASTDGGKTFGEAISLNQPTNPTQSWGGKDYPLHFQTAFGRPYMMAHQGVILAVADGGPPTDAAPPSEVFKGIFGEPLPMLVARSTDQGRTWKVSKLSGPRLSGTGSHTGMAWTPHGGPQGTIVFAYAATPGNAPTSGKGDIVVQRSTDLGVTWSEPVAINDDDPKFDYTSFYPQLDVAPNGRIDVVWQDNRDQTDYKMNVRYSYSTDGGLTWAPNMKVNDRPIDFNFGISFNSDLRQPPGVASTDQYAAIAWADTRFADEESQTQDNFGVVAQFAPLPTEENTTLPYIAAVFGGLVVAGLVLLLLQSARKKA